MYNHNKAQQNKNRVHISWDIMYVQHQVLKAPKGLWVGMYLGWLFATIKDMDGLVH